MPRAVRCLLRMYLRTRLRKIEQHVAFILNDTEAQVPHAPPPRTLNPVSLTTLCWAASPTDKRASIPLQLAQRVWCLDARNSTLYPNG